MNVFRLINFMRYILIKAIIYNIKKKLENKINNFISTDIEWIPHNYIELSKEQKENIFNFFRKFRRR